MTEYVSCSHIWRKYKHSFFYKAIGSGLLCNIIAIVIGNREEKQVNSFTNNFIITGLKISCLSKTRRNAEQLRQRVIVFGGGKRG